MVARSRADRPGRQARGKVYVRMVPLLSYANMHSWDFTCMANVDTAAKICLYLQINITILICITSTLDTYVSHVYYIYTDYFLFI